MWEEASKEVKQAYENALRAMLLLEYPDPVKDWERYEYDAWQQDIATDHVLVAYMSARDIAIIELDMEHEGSYPTLWMSDIIMRVEKEHFGRNLEEQ